ncbi:MAG: FMN-binding negative transcriptional regulator [Microbacterium sp.]
MYTYPDYAPHDEQQLAEFVASNPFAAMVSIRNGVPVASHLPVIPAPDTTPAVGGVLWSHMGRVNRQWRTLESGDPVLLVFTASHAYVSAGLYDEDPAVPTWNYSAVHVTAVPELLPRGVPTMEVLTETVHAMERPRRDPWDMTSSLPRFEQLVGDVVAFKLHITEWQAMFKLSQDKDDTVWQKVHDSFAAHPPTACLAHDMSRVRDASKK